jgi:hypothetical protein
MDLWYWQNSEPMLSATSTTQYSGFIYAAHSPSHNLVKIGWGKKPEKRVAIHQAKWQMPDLVLVMTIAHDDAWVLETRIHNLLYEDQVTKLSRDWFRATPDVFQTVEWLRQGIFPKLPKRITREQELAWFAASKAMPKHPHGTGFDERMDSVLQALDQVLPPEPMEEDDHD